MSMRTPAEEKAYFDGYNAALMDGLRRDHERTMREMLDKAGTLSMSGEPMTKEQVGARRWLDNWAKAQAIRAVMLMPCASPYPETRHS